MIEGKKMGEREGEGERERERMCVQ